VARSGREGKSVKARFEDVQWLNDVREVRRSLSANRSISVREVHVATGDASPQPTEPFPERHPFCEFNIILEGKITQFVGAEKVERRPGDVMLLGTGVPHYALRHSRQHRTFTIYFLPLVLFEMGPVRRSSFVPVCSRKSRWLDANFAPANSVPSCFSGTC
jgi:quercetin dioxygenase-like cupin family protein